MTARITLYRMLWRAALAQSTPQTRAVVGWTTALATLLMVAIGWAGTGPTTGIAFGVGTPAVILLMIWATLFVPGAAEMSTPANAQLTPMLLARLRELTALVWAIAMAAMTAGLVLLMEAAGLMLLWIILLSLTMALGMAGVRSAGYLTLPVWMGFLFKGWLPDWLLAGLAHPVVPLMILVALGPIGMLAARVVLPRGGDRHWELAATRQRVNSARQGYQGNLESVPGWLRFLPQLRSPRATPGGLLLRALGPDARALTVHFVAVGCLTLAVFILLFRQGILPGVPPDLFNPGTTNNIMLLFLFQVGTTALSLTRSAGEQALLRLAPAMPAERTGFNRLVARTLLGQALGLWAIVSGGALFLAWLTGGVDALPRQAATCCMTLPALALVLRDHARAPRWHMLMQWMAAVGLSLVGPIAGALLAWAVGLPFGPTATMIALALAAVLVGRGLGASARAPFAFPAGRLD